MTDQNRDLLKLKSIFKEAWYNMPFNHFLGIEIISLEKNNSRLSFSMKDEFVGNYTKGGTLHGGVIASILDVSGGVTASFNVLHDAHGQTMDQIRSLFSKSGTIDLRIDYLRPGQGDFFYATGIILRVGKRVAVTRMELKNDQEVLVAVGTGTYIVG